MKFASNILVLLSLTALSFLSSPAASAQVQSESYRAAAHSVFAESIDPENAESILSSQGATLEWEFESDDDVYRPRNDSRIIEIAKSLGFDADVGEITDHSEADEYIEKTYLFVKNGTDYSPVFGVQHGAMGAAFHRAGTSFDQVSLFSELLHVAGVSHTINVGTISITEGEILELVGVSSPRLACEILANGGVPVSFAGANNCSSVAEVPSETGIVKIVHAWVIVPYQGEAVILDPALKTYQWSDGDYDFIDSISPSREDVSSAIGGTWDGSEGRYSGPNPIDLDTFLKFSVSRALLKLEDSTFTPSAYEIIGGRRLVVTPRVIAEEESRYVPWSGLSSIDKFPKELKSKVKIDLSVLGVLPFGNSVDDGYSKVAEIFLEFIGFDTIALSPIHIASPDSIFNFSGSMDAGAAAASFELSIMRPGSLNHEMMASTGLAGYGPSVSNIRNDSSGDNLLEFEYDQRQTNRANWQLELSVDSPFAVQNSKYGDFRVVKRPSVFTLSSILIQSGESSDLKRQLYERFLPKKTNMGYGLFVDDSLQLYQCEQQRSNPQFVGGGGGIGGGGGGVVPVFSAIGRHCAYFVNNGCADTIHGCQPDEPGGTTMTVSGGISCPIHAGAGLNYDAGGNLYNLVSDGGGGGGGGGVTYNPQNACIADLSSQFPTIVSHDKMLRTKSLLAAQWHDYAAQYIDLSARLKRGRGTHIISLGVVSSDIIHDYDLSLLNDALRIDVDTVFSISGMANEQSRRAMSIAAIGGLSALEGIILQKTTGAPRVDSAASKADWYSWNGNYPDSGGRHYGPYTAKESYGDNVDKAGQVNGVAHFYLAEGATARDMTIRPERSDLGPAEESQWNYLDEHNVPGGLQRPVRDGRKSLRTTYSERSNSYSVGHIIGASEKGGSGAKLPELKAPELDEEVLSQDGNEALYGKFQIDDQLGFLSFSPNAYLSVGDDYNGLAFSATYEGIHANAGPLGQGWSHNHDGKIILSTNLSQAISGNYVHPALPLIVTTLSSYATADVSGFGAEDAMVFPQTLMINGWMLRNVYENEAQVSYAAGSSTFYNLPGVGYVNPAVPNSSLTSLGERKIYEGVKPYFSDNTKTQMRRAGLQERQFMPGFAKIDHVKAEQYFDYSDMGFIFIGADKSIVRFGKTAEMDIRLPSMLTDRTNIACWPNPLTPFIEAYSAHDPNFCGGEAGSFQILDAEFSDGRRLKYIYDSENETPVLGGATGGVTLGSSLKSVQLWSPDVEGASQLLNKLEFSYLPTFGVRLRPFNNVTGLDNPTDPDWRITNSLLIPDSTLTHGQTLRLHEVSWSSEDNAESRSIRFSYDLDDNDFTTARHSPLLSRYVDTLGHAHSFNFRPLEAEQNDTYDQINLLKSFTPASLEAPIFDIDYSSLGKATTMTDAEGRKVKYGVNGVVNTVTDAAGAETTNLYDSQGRLVSTIAPEYTVSEPQ